MFNSSICCIKIKRKLIWSRITVATHIYLASTHNRSTFEGPQSYTWLALQVLINFVYLPNQSPIKIPPFLARKSPKFVNLQKTNPPKHRKSQQNESRASARQIWIISTLSLAMKCDSRVWRTHSGTQGRSVFFPPNPFFLTREPQPRTKRVFFRGKRHLDTHTHTQIETGIALREMGKCVLSHLVGPRKNSGSETPEGKYLTLRSVASPLSPSSPCSSSSFQLCLVNPNLSDKGVR